MKLTIDRNEWYRGDPAGSALLRNDGRRCCVGIYLKACGVPDDLMHGRTVHDLNEKLNGSARAVAPWLFNVDLPMAFRSTAAKSLFAVNDAPLNFSDWDGGRRTRFMFKTEVERETEVKSLFEANGVEVEFVG